MSAAGVVGVGGLPRGVGPTPLGQGLGYVASLWPRAVLHAGPAAEAAPSFGSSRGWGWWWFGNKDLRDERIEVYADSLPRGTYEYTYLLRAGLAGQRHGNPAPLPPPHIPHGVGAGPASPSPDAREPPDHPRRRQHAVGNGDPHRRPPAGPPPQGPRARARPSTGPFVPLTWALVPAGADGWWERGAQPGTYTIEPNSTYPLSLIHI